MITLAYTDEMKKQDQLWESENEDTQVMKRLYNEIIEEAKVNGFEGYIDMYEFNGEMVAQIFENEEQYKLACLGKGFEDSPIVGYCKPLIEHLEEMLNKS